MGVSGSRCQIAPNVRCTREHALKTILLLSTSVVALAATAIAAQSPTGIGPRAGAHSFQSAPSHLLYNQNSTDGQAVNSQNFTSGSTSDYDAAADDFLIPAGETWDVKKVDAAGVYYNGKGPAFSEVITFYGDNKGQPGKTRASYALNCADTNGNFACTIPGPHGRGLKLAGGTAGKRFWLSVVANCSFTGGCGQWGWYENSKIRHNEAMWENPGNGFGTGCTTWTPVGDCFSNLKGDLAFDLRGAKL